jgi:hypothetical protein
MTVYPSFLANILLDDGELAGAARSDGVSPAGWLAGCRDTLHALYSLTPYGVSRAILEPLRDGMRLVTIKPADQTRFSAGRLPGNAGASPDNPLAATAPGRPTEDGPTGVLGTGGGSNVTVRFTPQDWDPPSSSRSLDVADEVLLHELVHALRQARGLEDNTRLVAPWPSLRRGEGTMSEQRLGRTAPPGRLSQIYHNLEEYCGVVVTNVYRSECGREGLLRDHLGAGPRELAYPLTRPDIFAMIWAKELARLRGEMPDVIGRIASVGCGWNPFAAASP